MTSLGKNVLGFTPPKIRGRVYIPFDKGGQVIKQNKNNDIKLFEINYSRNENFTKTFPELEESFGSRK